MSNQSDRHVSFRTIGGGTGDYNSDAFLAFRAQGATSNEWAGAFIQWLQIQTCSTKTNVDDLKAEFAINVVGVTQWDHVGAFVTASFITLEDGCLLLLEDGCALQLES